MLNDEISTARLEVFEENKKDKSIDNEDLENENNLNNLRKNFLV